MKNMTVTAALALLLISPLAAAQEPPVDEVEGETVAEKPLPRLTFDDYKAIRTLYEAAAKTRFRDKETAGKLDEAIKTSFDKLLGSAAQGGALERELAVLVLPRSKDERVPAVIVKALADDDASVRRLAAMGIIKFKPEQLTRHKKEILAAFKSTDDTVRASAVRVVGQMKDKETVAPLSEALADEAWLVRLTAARALGALGKDAAEAVPALEEALTDENGYVRVFAAKAIGAITGKEPPIMGGGQKKPNPLKEIHDLMGEASGRLDKGSTGLPTQEVQERITADMDKLIKAIQNSKPKGGGGKGKGKGKKKGEGKGQGQGKGKPTAGGKPGQGGGSPMMDSFATSGSKTHGAKRDVVTDEASEWGNLPDKLRDEVDQALKDKFPDRYKDLLKRYYIRLAEDEVD